MRKDNHKKPIPDAITEPESERKKERRHIIVKVLTWGAVSFAFTFVLSYFTKGYWEPQENVHFIEFATVALSIIEDA